eukprot:CAMPEP_0116898164 /NCGR_PEP_ID=MMETSP0467-20121206/6935_1 /TAXON_ID=283647 /ORGANISM="Mesodinium pulex, Strain SPMC105" /LENGTH=52 /DNA_ID=CAMNT_0004570115 /DNA_START=767 /DNA_END=925 /DNA_ORIENTATION=+
MKAFEEVKHLIPSANVDTKIDQSRDSYKSQNEMIQINDDQSSNEISSDYDSD